ncbi:piggyBac transposable element-derived protein 3-like [Schistocerca piceifrons]|uniref:piggyBac transposable element-derived protein 3-like n=1 Tax=Schistocerca piceifrons TaxID=274613 RepID=UPI001F5E7814|nr:piggyBac transposable element-derived protein 3-like [Schistocerca piceifrons]
MVPYNGTRAGNLRQYIQNKPHKWGFKIFVRAGVSGVVYDFLPYTGKGMITDLADDEKVFGIGGQVVVTLCKNEKQLLKQGRSSYDYRKDSHSDLILVRRADNKIVTHASSFCGVQPLSTYNKHMGGVDLAGMLIELYRIPMKTRRWYMRLFGFMLDLSVVNTWLVFRRESLDKKTSLKSFRADIANGLMFSGERKVGRPSIDITPPQKMRRKPTAPTFTQDVRFHNMEHWPVYGPKGRCRYCPSGYSTDSRNA